MTPREQTYAQILACTMRATAKALAARGCATDDYDAMDHAGTLMRLIPHAHQVDRHTLDLEALHAPESATLRTMILSHIDRGTP